MQTTLTARRTSIGYLPATVVTPDDDSGVRFERVDGCSWEMVTSTGHYQTVRGSLTEFLCDAAREGSVTVDI